MKARTAIWFLVFVWHSSMAQMVVDAALSNINRLRDLGISFIYTHQPDSALYYLEASYRNAKHYEGDTHVVVGELAHDLGYVHMSGNDFTAAKTMFVEALRIKRLHYVSPHAEIAITLNALGILFETDSDYIQAESFFLEARDQWAGSLGRDHLRYSWVQHNLGRMYSRMGRAQEAVDCLTDALRIKQEHLPSDDPELGHTWLYLSTALLQLGDVPGYEACALRAAEIWKKQKGINDMLYYWSRDNLANMNLALGHYNHSISLGREALEGKLRLYGTELHDDVALSLQVLSNAYTALEQHDSAYIYLMRAKPIYEKLNPGSLELALCLHNLGTNQYQLNHFEASRDFLRQSLDIKKEISDTFHQTYYSTLLHFAQALIRLGDLNKAEQLVYQAISFYETQDLTQDDHYLFSLDLLSQIQYKQEKTNEALTTLHKANLIHVENFSIIAEFASEGEVFTFLKRSKRYLDQYFNVAHHCSTISIEHRKDLYQLITFHKRLLLEKYLTIRNQTKWDSTSLRTYQQLLVKQKMLVRQQLKMPAERRGIGELQEEIVTLQQDLSKQLRSDVKTSLRFESIRDKLQEGEAAIEFVEYEQVFSEYDDSIWYGAMLVTPASDAPEWIPLFEERSLRALMPDAASILDSIGIESDPYHGSDMYNLIWTPLLPHLMSAKRVYFSAAGLLHRINFNAIPTPANSLLGDEFELIQSISTGSILMSGSSPPLNRECILAGGIRYEIDTLGLPGPISKKRNDTYQSSDTTITLLRGNEWKYLPGTEEEIDLIARLLKTNGYNFRVWKGFDATEEEFKHLSRSAYRSTSPFLIHLSTHGFFYPDKKNDEAMLVEDQVYHMIQDANNPLIRSGLLLAGSNYAWKNGKAVFPWLEDGILTAYEIASLDLSNTELIVLSACDTGLGDVEGNDGVYGLQRALKIAGVKYILMSLWQVPDAATMELMTRFYKAWLKQNLPVRKALYQAQKEMRKEGYEPLDWAGFILIE